MDLARAKIIGQMKTGAHHRPALGEAGAAAAGLVFLHAVAADGHGRQLRGDAACLAQQVVAAHVRQADVADQCVEPAAVVGRLHFNDFEYLSVDLNAHLADLQVMDVDRSEELPFYGHIWGSGSFTLDGPVHAATLASSDADLHPRSVISIPIVAHEAATDAGFIVFADSTGRLPDVEALTRRTSLFQRRPEGERKFLAGLDLDLNLLAREGVTVELIMDPLLGDVITAEGTGRLQLIRSEGELSTFGTLDVVRGDYLFEAGEFFFRRFLLARGGTKTAAPSNAACWGAVSEVTSAHPAAAPSYTLCGTTRRAFGLSPKMPRHTSHRAIRPGSSSGATHPHVTCGLGAAMARASS